MKFLNELSTTLDDVRQSALKDAREIAAAKGWTNLREQLHDNRLQSQLLNALHASDVDSRICNLTIECGRMQIYVYYRRFVLPIMSLF